MEPVDPKKSKPSDGYLKYGNLAFQLFGAVGLAGYAGYRLDKHFGYGFPVFLLSFILITFSGMLYQVYRSLNKD